MTPYASERLHLDRITVSFDSQPFRHLLRLSVDHRRNHDQAIGLALVSPFEKLRLAVEDIALLYRLWNFPALNQGGGRVAPGWFETVIPQIR